MRNSILTQLTIDHYLTVYNDLEKFCIENTGILLFGEFGNASFPSISDLDVFVCLKDENFISDYKKILNFIDSDETRQYLFFHDPLIIPESILPFLNQFHTLYNLNFTYKKYEVFIPFTSPEQLHFLNTIWTTYLMGICPGILINQQFGIRDKLLVLKNICQSIVNIDDNSDALVFNEKIRNQVMNGELLSDDINKIFESKLRELFFKSNEIKISNEVGLTKKNKFKINKNKTFLPSNQNAFLISKNDISIFLNNRMFNFLEQLYSRKSKDNLLQIYIDNSMKVDSMCRKFGLFYPFISPFGYQFYRTDLKFEIKRNFFV